MKNFFIAVLIIVGQSFLVAQSVRAVRDSVGFCWNSDEMNRFVKFLDKRNEKVSSPKENLVAAISVHDDYLYAGDVYYPLFKNINTKEVIIFGVTHGSVKKEIENLQNILILDEFEEWQGVYSNVKISPLREFIKQRLNKTDFIVSNKAHSIEHSIEALLPFLQYYNRNIKITPIMVTQMPFQKMEILSAELSAIVSEYIGINKLTLGKDIFILISNDANHYGEDFKNSVYGLDLKAHKIATDKDKIIIQENLVGKITAESIENLSEEIIPNIDKQKQTPLWCGRFPITFGLLTTEKILKNYNGKNLTGKLFKYSDTLTEKVLPFHNTSMGLTAIFSTKHWCGWFTLGLYQK